MEQGINKVSVRRIVAMAVAIGCHLGLLLMVLRPATFTPRGSREARESASMMELQLITPAPPPVAPPPSPALPELVRRAPKPLRPTQAPSALASSPMPSAPVSATATPDAPIASDAPPSLGDGGFHQRLQAAQQAGNLHGVPGSDLRRAQGIQLTDPRNQGIGAVMRNAQRLFGVTSSHCVDVEVWSNLSPQELLARHLTPADVEAANQKYQCNRPLGLSF